MKLVRYFMVCMVMHSIAMFATSSEEHKGYQNQIENIQEISTNQGSNFIVTFQQTDPICNFAPETYEESLDGSVHRYFMPRTTMAYGIDSPFDMQSGDSGTELVFYAKTVRKIISGNKVMFSVKQ